MQGLFEGKVLPLTSTNIYHVGNPLSASQPDAFNDLMNRLDLGRGRRHAVSRVDVAICRDLNVPVKLGCNRADIAGLGGAPEPDGRLTMDDVVVFARAYFDNDLSIADLVGVGASATPDGQITADDMIAFFRAFFVGCP